MAVRRVEPKESGTRAGSGERKGGAYEGGKAVTANVEKGRVEGTKEA